jgi:phage-related protein
MTWQIELFELPNGRCPVKEFLETLNPKSDLPYIYNAFKQLEEHGYKLDRPLSGFLEDGIYELRVKTINGQFRFLYFFFHRDTIVVTNGLHKKSQKVPVDAIKKAKEYRAVYLQRNEIKR